MKKILSILSIFFAFATHAQVITTFAGNGTGGSTGDGGQATAASIDGPNGLAFDGSGNTYISAYRSHSIRMVSSSGIVSTIGGSGVAGFSGDGGPATLARLNHPVKILRDASGNCYVADCDNNRVRKISPSGIISTFAGSGFGGFTGDGVQATASGLFHPVGLGIDGSGNIYIADYDNNRIRKVSATGIITTVAGTGIGGSTGDGGQATAAKVYRPWSITVDIDGSMYIGDQQNHKVRKIATSGIISTFAGTGVAGFSGDGSAATAAKLNNVSDVALDALGNVYLADQLNNCVRKIMPDGKIFTIVGTGVAGFSGDFGSAMAAQINLTNEIEVAPDGVLYICDNSNNRVRRLGSCVVGITAQPLSEIVATGDTATFTVTTIMPTPSYQWQVNSGTGFINLVITSPYSGVTTNSLMIDNAAAYMDGYLYRCILYSGDLCTDTSETATLGIDTSSSLIARNISKDEEVNIFPVPARSCISVFIPDLTDEVEVQLVNSLGRSAILSRSRNNLLNIDISNVPSGIYIAKIQFGSKMIVRKVLIE